MPSGIIAAVVLMLLLILWPLFLMDIMILALMNLGIDPFAGFLIVMGIFLGSFINFPVKRYRERTNPGHYLSLLYGMERFFPPRLQSTTQQVIAVNVGGCLIPALLVVYELVRLAPEGDLIAAGVAVLINVAICYGASQPLPGVGIVLPVFLPGFVAALSGLLLSPHNASAVAFSAGVLGPLIGADLLRLRQIRHLGMGVASIGGAGTFDGIVVSGVIALLLS